MKSRALTALRVIAIGSAIVGAAYLGHLLMENRNGLIVGLLRKLHHRGGPLVNWIFTTLSLRENEEVLVGEQVHTFDFVEAGALHPIGHLLLGDHHCRLIFMGSLIGFEVDDDESAALFD